ncbi:flagellin [Sphingomonas morindae]|uniref:Flagellin n=1 Tax=Sphingomonas morindae TaxID=1541170 RepID=A0ABY4XAM7_9SPHN|nr:flagellin [Sphingomonas morindae]USI73745.1 hypothetical protein LHA26_04550 [Sphingomonas morindae]
MITSARYSIPQEMARQKALSDSIAQLQTDISSGVKIHQASDDPVAARQIAKIRSIQASYQTYKTNIATATQISSQVQDSLDTLQTSMIRAKELIIQAKNGTANSGDRAAIAAELQGIAAEVTQAQGATDSAGNPIYTPSGTEPILIPVGENVQLPAAASSDDVFGNVKLADGSTSTLSDILQNAITAFQNNDATGMQTALTSLDAAQSHLSLNLTDAGVRAQRITAADDRLENRNIDLTDQRSTLEDTDITAASAELMQKKLVLDAAQSILAQLSKTSLFDKLT